MYTNHPYGHRPRFFLVQAPQMPLAIAQPGLRLWGDILHTKPLLQLVDPGNQVRLHDNLKTLISKNPELSTLVSAKSHLILMKRDGNDSARALMFGVLIAASVAIHNQTDEAADMQETLSLLLASAVELRGLYSEGHGYLMVQSGKFPDACHAVIQLIQWVKDRNISTTDLVYLANKGHEAHLPDSSLARALTDLSHYVFYLAAQASLKNIPFKHEQEKVHFIRERDDKLSRTMLDLLRTNVSYTASNRHLIYDYLKVRSQHMTIATNLDVHTVQEGAPDRSMACITLSKGSHTTLLLDERIFIQINREYARGILPRGGHLDAYFESIKGIKLTLPWLTDEDQLRQREDEYIQLCLKATECFDKSSFKAVFDQLRDLFLDEIRPITWEIRKSDVLCELEQTLSDWQVTMSHMGSQGEHFVLNKAYVLNLLQCIYRGDVPPLFDEPQNMTIKFCIGGKARVVVDLGHMTLTPKAYQQALVFISGINRASIRVGEPECKAQLDSLVTYIRHLQQFIVLDPHHQELIKQHLAFFMDQEITKHMPTHFIPENMPGRQAYLHECINRDREQARFKHALKLIDLSSSSVEESAYLTPTGWPSVLDLNEFERSIRENDACATAWEARFREQEPIPISDYFVHIQKLIEAAPHDDYLRVATQWLKCAKRLKDRSELFGVDIMLEAAQYSTSPRVLKELPLDVYDDLDVPQEHPVTQTHLRHQGLATRRPSGNTDRMSQLRGQLLDLLKNYPDTQAVFDEQFNRFKEQVKTFIRDNRDQHRDAIGGMIVDALQQIRLHLTRDSEGHYVQIKAYFKDLNTRYQSPFPEAVENAFELLKARYTQAKNERSVLKLQFLNRLEIYVRENITDTYTACIQAICHDRVQHDFSPLFLPHYTLGTLFRRGPNHLDLFLDDLRALDNHVFGMSADTMRPVASI